MTTTSLAKWLQWHSVTSQKVCIFSTTTVRISYLAQFPNIGPPIHKSKGPNYLTFSSNSGDQC